MRRMILATAALLASMTAVQAQQATNQPPFVPFIMDQEAYQAIMTYLGEVPAKYANPLIGALAQREQAALKAKSDAEKGPPAKVAEPEK
jgi:hypothetical protein